MDDVFYYLRKICASKGFVAAPRLAQFLTHVVTTTQRGETEDLHLSALAHDIWGSTGKTSDVKGAAMRIRRKLAAYYLEHGKDDPIRIELPEGAYVANIEDRRIAVVGVEDSPPSTSIKRRIFLTLEADQDIFVKVTRTSTGSLVLEIADWSNNRIRVMKMRNVGDPEPEIPRTDVSLLTGENKQGERIYAMVEQSRRQVSDMKQKILARQSFNPNDYGKVVANGRGEPPLEVRLMYGSELTEITL